METTTKENDQTITAKSCSYGDIGNILISSASKAIFIDGVSTIILTGGVQRNMPAPIIIAKAIVAGFVSYAIREYSTKWHDDMQYPGGVVGGALKYWIKGNNPILGVINNLGYEVCNFHKLNPYICKYTLETGEEIVKSWLGMPAIINNPLLSGIVISSVLTISSDVVYSPLDQCVKTAFNFTADNNNVTISKNQNADNFHPSTFGSDSMVENNVCLVGEDPVWQDFDFAYPVCGIS